MTYVKSARFLIATSGIFVGGALGHIIGSGSLHVGNSHFIFLLLIAFAALGLSRQSLEGPRVAFAIALAQFGTHFFFSTSGNAGDLKQMQMAMSHLVFGAISYQLVRHIDAIIELIYDLSQTLAVHLFEILTPICQRSLSSKNYVQIYHPQLLALTFARRGPPVIAAI